MDLVAVARRYVASLKATTASTFMSTYYGLANRYPGQAIGDFTESHGAGVSGGSASAP